MLSQTNEFVLFFSALGGFFVIIELGFRWGKIHRPGIDETTRDHIKALQTALLGLLALLLGFNFAMASSRFDARRALIQEEVNTINSAWSRAKLLPPPHRTEVMDLLEGYVNSRIDFAKSSIDETSLNAANNAAFKVETRIWQIAGVMLDEGKGSTQAGMFLQSFNDMVNIKSKRHSILEDHVPEPVLHLLFIVALGAMGFIGYNYGLVGRRRHRSTAIFALLIAMVLATILDFDRPRGGFIRVNEDGLVRLKQSIDRE